MSLKVVNLSKRYKDKWALRDVSFEVEKGEIFGVFGPTGSGKSTLASAVIGASTVNGGAVHFDGSDVTSHDSRARKFTTPRRTAGTLWDRIRRNGHSLSKGEDALRSLKNAIDGSNTVLVLDDPFCGIDAGARSEMIERLRTATAAKGLRVVFASNDFNQVLELCDRAVVLVAGDVKQIGVPQEIYEKPESRIVAELTGRNNLFAARRLTSSKADVPEFHTIDGSHRLFAQRIERGELGALNQNVTLAIRPEQISLSFGASFPADNLLKATITKISFLGPTTLVELDADGLKLEALVPRLVGLSPGDECMVGLPPDRIQILRN